MDRIHLLTAELLNYSFENYRNHLGIGHDRFEELMPKFTRTLERAEKEEWSSTKVARELEIEERDVPDWIAALNRAQSIVDAATPAESFRLGVRYAVLNAIEDGLSTDEDVDALTKQICHRVSDLSVLLDIKGDSLSQYSDELRREGQDGA